MYYEEDLISSRQNVTCTHDSTGNVICPRVNTIMLLETLQTVSYKTTLHDFMVCFSLFSQVYLHLLKMYLSPADPKSLGVIAKYSTSHEPQPDFALQILEKHANNIDTARVSCLSRQFPLVSVHYVQRS